MCICIYLYVYTYAYICLNSWLNFWECHAVYPMSLAHCRAFFLICSCSLCFFCSLMGLQIERKLCRATWLRGSLQGGMYGKPSGRVLPRECGSAAFQHLCRAAGKLWWPSLLRPLCCGSALAAKHLQLQIATNPDIFSHVPTSLHKFRQILTVPLRCTTMFPKLDFFAWYLSFAQFLFSCFLPFVYWNLFTFWLFSEFEAWLDALKSCCPWAQL